jgi:hypothetical protein
MSKITKTPKGTSLPLMNLKGKDYLQVAYRIVWFREEEPQSGIETKYLILEADRAVCQATITRDGKVVAMATKSEDRKGFADFIEKSETGAIGRALALLGYGTQFTLPDLDEGDRLADSPVQARIEPVAKSALVVDTSSPSPAPVAAVSSNNVAVPVARKPFNRPQPAAPVAAKPVSNGTTSAAEFD